MNSIRCAFLACLFLATTALVGCDLFPESFTPADGEFTVEFPGHLEVKTWERSDPGATVHSMNYDVRRGRDQFGVMVRKQNGPEGQPLAWSDPQGEFEKARYSLVRNARVAELRDITIDGRPARDVSGDFSLPNSPETWHFVIQMIIDGSRYYVIGSTFSKETCTESKARAFVSSFRLKGGTGEVTDRTPPPAGMAISRIHPMPAIPSVSESRSPEFAAPTSPGVMNRMPHASQPPGISPPPADLSAPTPPPRGPGAWSSPSVVTGPTSPTPPGVRNSGGFPPPPPRMAAPGGPFGSRAGNVMVVTAPASSAAGYNTPFAGSTRAGSFRIVEPGRLVVGLDYREGEWDGERCLGQLRPVFNADQAVTPATTRVLAPSGYTIGGLEVRTGRFVRAVRPVFLKVNSGGRLETTDRREGQWVGVADATGETTMLGNDGRGVIGLDCSQGAVIDGLALVMDSPGR